MALAIFAPTEGSLAGVAAVTAVLRMRSSHNGSWMDVVQVPLSKELLVPSCLGPATGILLGGLSSADKGKSWWFTRLGNVMHGPRNFQDARFDLSEDCEGAGLLTRPAAKELGTALKEHYTFNMKKGAAAVPSELGRSALKVGLGWTTRKGSGQIDLDASVLLLGARPGPSGYRPILDTVWHNDTQAPGVTHSGDNRTGVGEGDDEVISLDLGRLAAAVER